MAAQARVLIIDDNPADVRLIHEALRPYPNVLELEAVPTLARGFALLHSDRFDAVLLDLGLPDGHELETLQKTRLAAPELPIIVLTGNQDVNLPLRAVRSGAQDYLPKSALDGMLLIRSVRHAIERMGALRELLESEERYRTLYERVDAGILEFDAAGNLTSANPALMHMLEYDRLPDILALRSVEVFWDPEEFRSWFIAASRVGRRKATKLRLRTATGRKVVALCSMHELSTRDGRRLGYQALLRDMTEVSRLSEQLSYEASHDSLTDLLNRRMFEALCREALESEGHLKWAFCYIDLDQFKIVNDTCGHLAGDELLKVVGSALRTCTGSTDILARLGGDEFAVLFRAQNENEANSGAERLLKAIEAVRFQWGSQIYGMTASIGLILTDGDHNNLEQLMSAADTACYAAKDQGGGRIYVGQVGAETLDRKIREMHWVIRIKAAVSENRLSLYQQPIVAAHDPDGPRQNFEILLRKVGAQGRIHTPAEFLPAVERYNFAATLDRWVINATLTWINQHRDLLGFMTYAINLSGQSIGEPAFLDYVEERLDSNGIPGNLLCFEVTESAAIRSLSAAQRLMTRLRERGCRFSLDDFGSGLSSFGYLRNFDIDYIKLDALFVKSICSDLVNRSLVRSFADVARAMGKQTIAEGVESREAIEVLRELGVDYVQGFGIEKPAPLSALLDAVITSSANALQCYGGLGIRSETGD